MKKSLTLLLSGSLCFTSLHLSAEELIEAANTNFGPRRPTGETESDEDKAKPAPKPAPAPKPIPAPKLPPPPKPLPPPKPIAKPPPPPPAPKPVARPVPAPAPVPVAAPAPAPVDVPAAGLTDAEREEVERAAREELVRRQEAQIAAQSLIREGQTAYDAGQYQEAATKFETALQKLPDAPATAQDRAEAIDGVVRANYRLADDALRAGDNAKARDFATKALEYDPANRAASSIFTRADRAERAAKEQAGKPVVVRPDRTEEFTAKQDKIKQLFRESKILINSGQYDEAEISLEQILLIDPYNGDAHQYLEELNKQRLDMAQVGQEASRNLRLWEVTKGWLPPINVAREELERLRRGGATVDKVAASKAKILEKLNTIVLEQISFRDADIRDVVNFLSDESRNLDSEKVGVNIIIQTGEAGAAAVTAPVAAPVPAPVFGPPGGPGGGLPIEGPPGGFAPAPAAPIEAEPASTGGAAPRISLTLRNIPLIEALKYVTTAAGLKFRVESHAVLVLPKEAPEGDLMIRTYRVEPGAFRRAVAPATGEGQEISGDEEFRALGGSGATIAEVQDVKKFFQDAGVPFPPGSSLVFNEGTSTIIVKNTPENLELFEKVLDTLSAVPTQVEIEARFVDIAQSDLDELGFDWKIGHYAFGQYDTFGGGDVDFNDFPDLDTGDGQITGGLRDSTIIQASAIETLLGSGLATSPNNVATLRGILTNPQFEVLVRAIAQKKSTDVLSAPKVTTISGNAAQIRVVQEFIYPTEFEQQVSQGVVSQIPSTFKTREVGVLLNVTPQVGPDGYTINLTLIPEVSEFLGFIDYSSSPSVGGGTGGTNAVAAITAKVIQPLFASRSLATSIIIWDGQTVVLGGLLREDVTKLDDKVPFLGDIPFIGRLFRSKVNSRSKRNLLIFVTARLVDPAGNLVHPPEPVKLTP